jgi:hypothetical protein
MLRQWKLARNTQKTLRVILPYWYTQRDGTHQNFLTCSWKNTQKGKMTAVLFTQNKESKLNTATRNTDLRLYRHNNNEATLAIFLTSNGALRKGERWYIAELAYVGLGFQNSFLCFRTDNFQLHVFIWYSLKYYWNRTFHSRQSSAKKTHSKSL